MKSVQHFPVLAFVMFGLVTTITINAHPIISRGVPPVYEQHIVINPLDGPSCPGSCCNCTAIREIVADELQDTNLWLAKQEAKVGNKVDGLSAELNGFKLQLDQITETVIELSALLRSTTAVPVTPSVPPHTPSVPPLTPHKDCSDALANGVTISGVYTVQPADHEGPFKVYCDMETDGGGWTVFQRRQDGSVDFYRDWESYRRGFGDLNGEFWLGNDNLHRLTAQGAYRLRVDLEDFENNTVYAEYDMFSVADGSDNYQLTVQGYSGTAGDSLSYHSSYPFSTKDHDNDVAGSECALLYSGAWWYVECHYSNLNGVYLSGQTDVYAKGVIWVTWKGNFYSLKRTEIKIKVATN
ncbi:microfibril-associated glycoprotein 4-like [Acanthaster planci]|uniref:Microfibril-associated glycoprotein 4-like n=1 Tax=Acanthaster planci TaxID=133434 RepID=A0A8B7ZR86_ACAPL|nr:microfibril-associated glycoprotein 4-like [Acanthaster planci]